MKTISKFKVLSIFCMFVMLLSCKKDEKEAEPTIVGKWSFMSRMYQEAGSPAQTENFSGGGYYIDIKENGTYTVLFDGESGSGTYAVNNNKISFDVVSGDDDITDEDTYDIKNMTNNELILEIKDGNETYQLRFTK